MTTIQFTYDKHNNHYCFGFWKDGEFIVRQQGKHKNFVWEQFCKELSLLEGNNDDISKKDNFDQ